MEKLIFVIRHAKSSWESSVRDIDRPLNERGKRTAPIMADIFKELILQPSLIISSPANRALSTARVFHSDAEIEHPIIIHEDLYYGNEDSYLESIQSVGEQVSSVALFGHNPKVEDFSSRVLNPYLGAVPTCAIMCFKTSQTDWKKLNWSNINFVKHYFPKELD